MFFKTAQENVAEAMNRGAMIANKPNPKKVTIRRSVLVDIHKIMGKYKKKEHPLYWDD